MSGFAKKAKIKAGRLVDKLRPSSRAESPAHSDPTSLVPSTGRHNYAEPAPPQKAGATTVSVVHEFLEAARDGSDLCLPLKAALVGAVKILEICERTAEIKDQYNVLASRLTHLAAVTDALSKRSHLDPNLKQRLENIAASFERLTQCVEEKLERGTVRRVLESKADVTEIKDILIKISARVEAFLYESTVRVEIAVDEICARLPTAEDKNLEKELIKWNEIVKIIDSALGIRRVHEAAHDTQPKDAACMQGTRVGVLSKFMEWVKSDPKSIFWLAGMAGTGNTSIALTLFAAALSAELKPASGSAAHKPVGDQIGPFLQRPLSTLTTETRPIVFIIDALDEFSNERDLAELLKSIATFACPANVKFILTSRPETHILGSPISNPDHNEILRLHAIDAEEVADDIRSYISDAFSKSPLTKPWYTSSDVQALAIRAEGLFIFASTIVSYVLSSGTVNARQNRLSKILSALGSVVAAGPLHLMYEFVLTRASDAAVVEPEELDATRHVLACILTSRMSLSVGALAELLGREADDLRESLRQLHAVVHVPEEDDHPGLRTLHASFGDYLFERAAVGLRISKPMGDEALARGCLQVMQRRLRFNISQSRSSFEENMRTKPDSITLCVEYTCMQWVYHVAGLSEPSALDEEIKKVFCPRFLFWLEVASSLRRVGRAAAMLIFAAYSVKLDWLYQFLRDGHTFVTSSRQAIERSAPHIYLSALPFAAKTSLIYQTFTQLCTGLLVAETFGIDRHGGQLIMTLNGHEAAVNAVAYSPDGQTLASGSDDSTIRIWDTRTGEETQLLLQGDDDAVESIAFALDGNSLVAGTRAGIVCIWNLLSGQVGPKLLPGHSEKVCSVVYSPSGSLIASGSSDMTIRLWSPATGLQVAVMNGHTNIVNAVAFSPDKATIASGSGDLTVRLWHCGTSEPVGQPLLGHTDWVRSVCFSPDGTKLASCSDDKDIRLWEPQTGTCIATLRGHLGWVLFVEFSPDAQSLISASSDRTVRMWDLQEQAAEVPSVVLGTHLDDVKFAAFAPHSLYVASASADGSIRIWNAVRDLQVAQSLAAHHEGVKSVAASPDSALIVSGSEDCSVRVWDMRTGKPMLQPLQGHTNWVYSVSISTDGRFIASASKDHTLRIWDLQTGEAIGKPLQGHEDEVQTVTFSPDAEWLVSGSNDRTVRIWNVATRHQSTLGPLLAKGTVYAVSVSPDSRLVAAGDDRGSIYVWSMHTGQRLYWQQPIQRSVAGIETLTFSPTGTCIASGGRERIGRVWDTSTGQQILSLEGHENWVRSIAYSPNGQFIVTGSDDFGIRLWDAETGEKFATLYGHVGIVGTITCTPDGLSIVSCSWDATIRVWDLAVASSICSKDDENNPVKALASVKFNKGWLVNASGELLMWVPEEYRAYLHVAPCTMVIGKHRVVVAANDSGLYCGENWTACWRGDSSM